MCEVRFDILSISNINFSAQNVKIPGESFRNSSVAGEMSQLPLASFQVLCSNTSLDQQDLVYTFRLVF